MKKSLFYSFLLLSVFVLTAVSLAGPRHERFSTEQGNDMERVSVAGKIDKISGQKALLITDEGERVTVHLGPQNYWREKGYRLRAGVEVVVSGWGEIYDDDDGGYCYAAEISGPGFFFDLCDSEGYPRWADQDDYDRSWRPSVPTFQVYYGCEPHYQWRGCPPPRYRCQPPPRHCEVYRPHPRYRWGRR